VTGGTPGFQCPLDNKFTNAHHLRLLFLDLTKGWYFLFPTFCLETKPTFTKASVGRGEPKIQGRFKGIIHLAYESFL
jgi:hypothetical protein